LITRILADEIAFEIGHFRTFQISVTLTFDRSYGIPSCSTHRPYLHATLHTNWKTFCGWMDRWAYVLYVLCTDRQTDTDSGLL